MTSSEQPPADRSELASFLAARDIPCPGCGYNLRALTSATCPECNQPIELRVTLSEPRIGAYLAAVSGLLTGGGIAIVFLLGVVVLSWENGWPNGKALFPVIILPTLMATTLLTLAVPLLMVRGRRWFRKLTRSGRIGVIAGCWLLMASFVAWFLILVVHH